MDGDVRDVHVLTPICCFRYFYHGTEERLLEEAL
jgi:hypothetical protein